MSATPREPVRGGARSAAIGLLLLSLVLAGTAAASSLESELGRNETRVLSAPFPLVAGSTIEQIDLPERLERLGYRRVHEKPSRAGEYFWGHRVFWIYRRAHRHAGRDRPARLLGLRLRRDDGMILGGVLEDGEERSLDHLDNVWLEPEVLAESLRGDRAVRRPLDLDDLPERVWRPVLAAEDARFFDHGGLDGRSLARAALANVRAGEVTQGGSTITQQLVKNRDLSPKRTLGRKASEALRALAIEADFDKREILQAYLNQVYLGHVEGLAVHGFGAASRVYFSKPAAELSLAEAALLAAMIQGPNRLTPLRHPERARERRDWILGRMEELDWASANDVAAARRAPLGLRAGAPERPAARDFLSWVALQVEEDHGARIEKGRGVVVETTLDAPLQAMAERAVTDHLRRLRREHPRLRGADLSAALVALDASSGEVLAYVGGDPGNAEDRFDRVRRARRQPGSAVKPLLLLEAFQDCGSRKPLHPASRVADEPLRVELPGGAWEPVNFDGRFHGVTDLRTALRHSYNVPFARLTRWCGPDDMARTLRIAGLDVPDDPPPSFALGSLETTPLELAGAYTVFATPGRAWRPIGVRRVEKPSGKRLSRAEPRRRVVTHAATGYLVRDLLYDTVANGTSRPAALKGRRVAGKTGTSSALRDAWFAGDTGNIVTVVWVGLDGGGRLGLTGGVAAAPLWRAFMAQASAARPAREVERPADVVVRRIDPKTGLLVSPRSHRGHDELFRRQATPRRKRFFRPDPPEPVIR